MAKKKGKTTATASAPTPDELRDEAEHEVVERIASLPTKAERYAARGGRNIEERVTFRDLAEMERDAD